MFQIHPSVPEQSWRTNPRWPPLASSRFGPSTAAPPAQWKESRFHGLDLAGARPHRWGYAERRLRSNTWSCGRKRLCAIAVIPQRRFPRRSSPKLSRNVTGALPFSSGAATRKHRVGGRV